MSNFVDWTVTCDICGKELDSHDSYADSREMLRAHMSSKHSEALAREATR